MTGSRALPNERGSKLSPPSSSSSFTNPPMGSQLSVYSCPGGLGASRTRSWAASSSRVAASAASRRPRRPRPSRPRRGPGAGPGREPDPELEDADRAARAVMKWPSSWNRTRPPSTMMNSRIVTTVSMRPVKRHLRWGRSRTRREPRGRASTSAGTSGAGSGPGRRSGRRPPRAGAGCRGSRGCRRGTGRRPPRRRRSAPPRPAGRGGRPRGRSGGPGSAPRRARGSRAGPQRPGRGAQPATGARSGWVSAYWMGRRMSGVPSWALSEPSMNRTAEWTTLCGWTTTSMAS